MPTKSKSTKPLGREWTAVVEVDDAHTANPEFLQPYRQVVEV